MAIYKVNNPIITAYQARNAATGETVVMSVFDETQAFDAAKSLSAMTEFGATGRYYGTFTPDVVGDWTVLMHEANGKGPAVKAYTVGSYGISDIGTSVEAISGAVIGDLEVDIQAVSGAIISDLETDIQTISGAVGTALADDFSGLSSGISNLDSEIDAISADIADIASPAMVG